MVIEKPEISIRTQIIGATLFLVCLSLLVAGVVSFVALRDMAEADQSLITGRATTVAASRLKIDSYLRRENADTIKALAGAEVMFITGAKVVTSTLDGFETLSVPKQVRATLKTGASAQQVLELAGQRYNVGFAGLLNADGELEAVAAVAVSRARLETSMNELVLKLLTVLAGAMVPCVLLARWLARRIARQLSGAPAYANGTAAAGAQAQPGMLAQGFGRFRLTGMQRPAEPASCPHYPQSMLGAGKLLHKQPGHDGSGAENSASFKHGGPARTGRAEESKEY